MCIEKNVVYIGLSTIWSFRHLLGVSWSITSSNEKGLLYAKFMPQNICNDREYSTWCPTISFSAEAFHCFKLFYLPFMLAFSIFTIKYLSFKPSFNPLPYFSILQKLYLALNSEPRYLLNFSINHVSSVIYFVIELGDFKH